MATVKFGTKQLQNPTPSGHSKVIDLFTAVAGVVIAWLVTATYIPNSVSNVISSILGLLIGVAQAVKPFFGVITTQHDIPKEDVTAMDATTDN